MTHSFTKISIYCSLCLSLAGAATAQNLSTAPAMDTNTHFVPGGKLWGYAFGDLAYKGSADSTNGGGRSGSNQYSKVPANANLFQWRRIYLGYNYDISPKFSAEFLLAAEDDFNNTALVNQGPGDVLTDGKFSPYVKLANIRWKGIFKNADFVFGQMNTPAFAKQGNNAQTAEEVWGYRSIERTITDIQRTPSYDFGASLQGTFDNKGNFGYVAMVANGQSAKPENDMFKAFYGDLFAKFMNKRLVMDLYQDYQKLNWTYYTNSAIGGKAMVPYHHDRNLTKFFIAYTVPKFTVGVEAFMNTLMGDVVVKGKDGNTYYRTTKAMGQSIFVKGRIYKEKLGFFARFDNFDPTGNLSNITGDVALNPKSYSVSTAQYDPTTKQTFATFGLDFTPMKNIHIMPNVWVNTYDCALSGSGTQPYSLNTNGTASKGTDAVYRLTFYYIYGK